MEYRQNIHDFSRSYLSLRKTNGSKYWNQNSRNSHSKTFPSHLELYLPAARTRNELYQRRMLHSVPRSNIEDMGNKDEENVGRKRNFLIMIFEWIFASFCILGMLCQCKNTTDGYLQYETTSEVNIKLEFEFNSPALGLCFNPVAFGIDEICNKSTLISEMIDCYQENVLDNSKLNQILLNFSSNLISRVEDAEKKFKIETFFKWYSCLYIHPKIIKTNLADITEGNAGARRIFQLFINLSNTNVEEFSLLLHDAKIYPRGIYVKTLNLILDNKLKNAYQVGYQYIAVELLPYPFKDECIDYDNLEYESHYHCMDRCVNDKIYEKYKKHHPYLLLRSKYFSDDFKFVNVSEIDFQQYYGSCKHLCPKNCIWKTYDVIPVDNWLTGRNETLKVAVDYLESNIALKYRARLNFEEYIIYMASVLTLWLGWCIHATPVTVFQSLKSIKFCGKKNS